MYEKFKSVIIFGVVIFHFKIKKIQIKVIFSLFNPNSQYKKLFFVCKEITRSMLSRLNNQSNNILSGKKLN